MPMAGSSPSAFAAGGRESYSFDSLASSPKLLVTVVLCTKKPITLSSLVIILHRSQAFATVHRAYILDVAHVLSRTGLRPTARRIGRPLRSPAAMPTMEGSLRQQTPLRSFLFSGECTTPARELGKLGLFGLANQRNAVR